MADSLTNRICEVLEARIMSGGIDSQSIITEQNIAEEFSASRGTAREALQRLADAHILVSLPRKGYMLCNITRKDFLSLFEVRLPLEKLCVEKALRRATDRELLDLKAAQLNGMSNTAFHLRLAELSGNKYLYQTLETYIRIATLYVNLYSTYDISTEVANLHHMELLDALIRRDPDAALLAITADLGAIDGTEKGAMS